MIPQAVIDAMWADYSAGMSLSAVARKHGNRDRESLREVLKRRGYKLRPPPPAPVHGRFVAAPPKTAKEITAIIARMTKVNVPAALRMEWKKWPMARRVAFIARARAQIGAVKSPPPGPYSANVKPWDYGSAEAWKIAYQGPSQKSKSKIKIDSSGVIWRGRLFYRMHDGSCQEGVGWTPEYGRPELHHLIWEEANGCAVPAGRVVVFKDGNKNNFAPRNLALATKNDILRSNFGKHYAARARQNLNLLLDNNRNKNENIRRIAIIAGGH